MRKLFLGLFLAAMVTLSISSCTPAGTVENVDDIDNDSIHVSKYYFKEGQFVYVVTVKNHPEAQNVTWVEHHGKSSTKRGAVIIQETDSTITYSKEQE